MVRACVLLPCFLVMCNGDKPGSSVNSPRLSLCCHGNGTHTECAAHVLPGRLTLADAGVLSGPSLLPCLLVTVRPEPLAASGDHYPPGQSDDLVLSLRRVREAVEGALQLDPWRGGECWAVAVRALDTDADKRWTGRTRRRPTCNNQPGGSSSSLSR